MSYLVISTSLHPESRSRVLAKRALESLKARGVAAELRDIAPLQLPMCDGGAAYGHPAVAPLAAAIAGAKGVLLAFPVYNYAPAASCKNLIELTGKAWTGKVVGLLAAAGGGNAFMAPLQIANSLMLDFRCVVLPKYVYGAGAAITPTAIADNDLAGRVDELAGEVVRVAGAISK